MAGFRKLGEEELFRGQSAAPIWVGEGEFEAPDGTRFKRDIVHHPGAVSVVPVLDDGRAVLVRQYRAPLDREILEIPAGKRDVAGEAPEVTARRELEEEVGLRAERVELLLEFHNSPGFCDEHSFSFLATGLTECAKAPVGVEEHAMQIEYVKLDDVLGLIAAGELTDAKSIIGLLMARERLARR
ncbi:MAG: ADP-ribose pyrophosphatase [Acidimicrobiaceae bacterium]